MMCGGHTQTDRLQGTLGHCPQYMWPVWGHLDQGLAEHSSCGTWTIFQATFTYSSDGIKSVKT